MRAAAAPGSLGDAFQQARMHRPDGKVVQGEVIREDGTRAPPHGPAPAADADPPRPAPAAAGALTARADRRPRPAGRRAAGR